MQKSINIFLLIFATVTLYGQTVDEILDKVEANEEAATSRIEMTQLIIPANGEERKSKLISLSMDKGDKGLMEYITPSRIKGMKILMLNDGDDIWFYSPRTSRVRKIASHQKKQSVNGSDFSYEDMSMQDMRKDYNGVLEGLAKLNGKNCFKIIMKAKDDSKTYAKTITWIDTTNYVMLKTELYDEDQELWKVMVMENIEKISGYWTPKKIEMKNIQKGSRTIMVMDKVAYDIKLKKNLFSERNLKR